MDRIKEFEIFAERFPNLGIFDPSSWNDYFGMVCRSRGLNYSRDVTFPWPAHNDVQHRINYGGFGRVEGGF